MNIGDRIKKRREFLKMSQDELALRLGYKSRSTITKIEKGVNDITQSKIAAFAKALDTTPAYLMGWDNQDDVAANETEITKDKNNNLDTQPFTSLDDAMLFLIKSPVASAYGGYDLDKMSEDEIIDFANELSGIFKVIAERRKK